MTRFRDMLRPAHWLLPVLLTAAQFAIWPVMPDVLETGEPGRADTVVAVLATAAAGLALCWRRVAPVGVLVVTAVATYGSLWQMPGGELLLVAVTLYVALFSVAVRRPVRQAVVATACVIVGDCVSTVLSARATGEDGIGDLVFSAVTSLTVGLVVLVFGRNRHRWHADRAAAADRLAEAETRSRQAADAERHRLARELHDVTAHHLTSIVVTASAAQRLAGTRPELLTEALRFASRTGRETLAALHRLVAVMQTPDEEPVRPGDVLEELADGFRLLGQVVSVDAATGSLPPAHADAVYGIAREALTNTVRYAPGGTVRVHLTLQATGAELVVTDDGSRAPGAPGGLGSGRGVTGMTERATALGGTLTAGPRPGGGWQVRAVLPSAPTHRPARARRWARIRTTAVIDVFLVMAALTFPGAALLTDQQEPGAARDAGHLSVLAVLVVVHALPLLWRRRHPWWVLGAVAATTFGYPLLVGLGAAVADDTYLVAVGFGADLLAVWAVTVHGSRPALAVLGAAAVTWSAAMSAGLVAAGTTGTPTTRDAAGATMFTAVVVALLVGVAAALPAVGVWAAGDADRRRRTRLLTGEDTALAVATYRAVESARAERLRVAAGLREAVLHRTTAVAAAADRGEIDAVLAEARAALAAMRGLLSGLRDAPAAVQPVAPQPTAAGIGALCDRHPEVRYATTGTARALPADVDVSAYRVVELLLGPGRPAQVGLHYEPDAVRITVTGTTPAADGTTAAGLRARVAAVGGIIVVEPSGMIDIRLPAPAPAPTEEVASSPSV